mmetsp:Transcript_41526/g.124097  ORF Transcript_41526/g.124097 Transcript_41526/m.124097 type:complete len:201 (-) Transcript_41526:257-859(-)
MEEQERVCAQAQPSGNLLWSRLLLTASSLSFPCILVACSTSRPQQNCKQLADQVAGWQPQTAGTWLLAVPASHADLGSPHQGCRYWWPLAACSSQSSRSGTSDCVLETLSWGSSSMHIPLRHVRGTSRYDALFKQDNIFHTFTWMQGWTGYTKYGLSSTAKPAATPPSLEVIALVLTRCPTSLLSSSSAPAPLPRRSSVP